MTPDDVIAELGHRGLLPIVESIANRHGVTVEEICGRRRHRAVMLARQACWAVMRSDRAFSYPELGRMWGRDHTTILSGVHRIDPASKKKRRAA